jgi:hypothetical protein
MRGIHRLTDREVRNDTPIVDKDGLYVRVSVGGTKAFLYRYAVCSRDTWMSLGNYPETSLAEARDKAAEQRALRTKDLDPLGGAPTRN